MYRVYQLTVEDLAIANRSPSARHAMALAFLDGARDSAIMAELSDRSIGRATLAPCTLACIGLPDEEFKAIARGDATLPSDAYHVQEREWPGPTCGHSACSQNYIDHGEAWCVDPDSYEELPAESWAGGFADNH